MVRLARDRGLSSSLLRRLKSLLDTGLDEQYAPWAIRDEQALRVDLPEIRRRHEALTSAPRLGIAILSSSDEGAARDATAATWATQTLSVEPAVHFEASAAPALIADWIRSSGAGWVGIVRTGFQFRPHAAGLLAEAMLADPAATIVYADEDTYVANDIRARPRLKPGWSPELLRGSPYLGEMVFVHADAAVAALDAMDSWNPWVYALRVTADAPKVVHVAKVLAHRDAATSAPAADSSDAARLLIESGAAHAAEAVTDGVLRPIYAVGPPVPAVAILIPTRDNGAQLERCLQQIATTAYPNFQPVIIDNGSTDPESLRVIDAAARRGVAVITDPRPFNFSELINAAVAQVDAEFLCIFNDDVEVMHADWLMEMASVLKLPGVGAVGALLTFPDGTIQHYGVTTGGTGGGANLMRHRCLADRERFGLPFARRECAAVTGACMLLRRTDFLAVGGMDPRLAYAFNDVDLCLRLRERGLRIVFTPFAHLLHHESMTRGYDYSEIARARRDTEEAMLRERWGPAFASDPYMNAQLSQGTELPRLVPQAHWQPL
jgi:GT2 family glycosyltransferase